jgi:hypothetical protein
MVNKLTPLGGTKTGSVYAISFDREINTSECNEIFELIRQYCADLLGPSPISPTKTIMAQYRKINGLQVSVHVLKTAKQPWQDILDNGKRTEYRYAGDRNFKVGDWLEFVCLNSKNEEEEFSPKMQARILHIQHGGKFGIPLHHVIMTISDPVGWQRSNKVCLSCEQNPCEC